MHGGPQTALAHPGHSAHSGRRIRRTETPWNRRPVSVCVRCESTHDLPSVMKQTNVIHYDKRTFSYRRFIPRRWNTRERQRHKRALPLWFAKARATHDKAILILASAILKVRTVVVSLVVEKPITFVFVIVVRMARQGVGLCSRLGQMTNVVSKWVLLRVSDNRA